MTVHDSFDLRAPDPPDTLGPGGAPGSRPARRPPSSRPTRRPLSRRLVDRKSVV